MSNSLTYNKLVRDIKQSLVDYSDLVGLVGIQASERYRSLLQSFANQKRREYTSLYQKARLYDDVRRTEFSTLSEHEAEFIKANRCLEFMSRQCLIIRNGKEIACKSLSKAIAEHEE